MNAEMEEHYRQIKLIIEQGSPLDAIDAVDRLLRIHTDDAYLYYLKGNAYMKTGDWRQATNCFLQSEHLDSESPASEARKMLADIMAFYNKDMYNQ